MDWTISRRSMIAGAMAGAIMPVMASQAAEKLIWRTPGGRDVAVSHWKPRGRRQGLILFSHGAQSAPWKYARLLDPWADAGWEIYAPLHVDSTDHPDTKAFAGLKSWAARIEDMRLLSDYVGRKGYVAAGHSYGGLTALTMGGAAAVVPEGVAGPLRDMRARAVVAFSPPAPIPVLITAEGYAALGVPALVQTGTLDGPPGPPEPPADAWRGHLAAYEAPPPRGDLYSLVYEGVDHYFGGGICRPELPGPVQLSQLSDATATSLLFADAYGRGDGRARRILDERAAAGNLIGLRRR
jgi:hypothetical protein